MYLPMTDTRRCGLPTLDKPLPSDIDHTHVAREWLSNFASSVERGDIDFIMTLILDDGFWRDMLSITWDIRSFHGSQKIRVFLEDRMKAADLRKFNLINSSLVAPFPDVGWVQGLFTFDIGDLGEGNGVFRIVPTCAGEWRAVTIYTNLCSLKDYPEQIGHYRNTNQDHGKWLERRRKEAEFEDTEPYVVVVGSGHSGLDVAARLKYLDVPTLVLEKESRIGDNWRARYESLCLHDTVWFDHMPYMPFPETWPVYTPAQKLADWLDYFANSLELNVWTSSEVTSVTRDPETKIWNVVVRRGKGDVTERILHPVHVIFAVGLMSGAPNFPTIPGQADFEGQAWHSKRFKSARENIGKKVVIIGTGTSAHDIASDHVNHGIDITMYQRSSIYVVNSKTFQRVLGGPSAYSQGGPPLEAVDLVSNSYPRMFLKWYQQRITQGMTNVDKDLLDGLAKRGFKYNFGEDGSGLIHLTFTRAGGYYINVGASDMVVDGRIKLKSDSLLERFTKKGLKFEDGSELEADVVIFATGFKDASESIRSICGSDIKDKIKPIWGLDEEGELRGVWRDSGVENLWVMMGNLSTARYHSRTLALQIKAMKERIFGERYSLKSE